MENVSHIIGADLSKKTIDFACYQSHAHLQISNDNEGFKQLLCWLREQKIKPNGIILVMEHTGLYSFCFENFLHKQKIPFSKVSALEIKRSSGLVRGKSDKIDAFRIASYGFEKIAKLQPEELTSKSLERLKMLQNTRNQLVRNRASIQCTIKEYQNIGLADKDLILKAQHAVIKALNTQIDNLESAIKEVIENDPAVKANYSLLTSVKTVGKVLAVTTIIKTGNFSKFRNARKFSCYCGTAPFEHSSGSSIKGKTRVSHLADKQMKTLLDLSAKCGIRYDKELKEFYERRLALGKSKMSTINVIRNKIIYRMFAVIKRQSPFLMEYGKAS